MASAGPEVDQTEDDIQPQAHGEKPQEAFRKQKPICRDENSLNDKEHEYRTAKSTRERGLLRPPGSSFVERPILAALVPSHRRRNRRRKPLT